MGPQDPKGVTKDTARDLSGLVAAGCSENRKHAWRD